MQLQDLYFLVVLGLGLLAKVEVHAQTVEI
jgi:hypothetical protein